MSHVQQLVYRESSFHGRYARSCISLLCHVLHIVDFLDFLTCIKRVDFSSRELRVAAFSFEKESQRDAMDNAACRDVFKYSSSVAYTRELGQESY